MSQQELFLRMALHEVAFEYYSTCRKNGATDAEAKTEMMTPEAQNEIKKRALELIK